MPKPRMKREINCENFRWLVGQRNGVYTADGRSNEPDLGRHSLGVTDWDEALKELTELDLTMAIRHGLADPDVLQTDRAQRLLLEDGRKIYEAYVRRPTIAQGPKPSTAKRYRPVLDKFMAFCRERNTRTWNEVSRQTFNEYASWLDGEGYAYATEYLELTTLKQILKYLVQEEHLPQTALFPYPMRRSTNTDTYCWANNEVEAVLKHCETPELRWLRSVLLTLARSGMRISELAGLRWADIDLQHKMITLTDESQQRSQAGRERRTTKSGYSRTFPNHPELNEHLTSLERHPDGLVFHGSHGGKIKPDMVRRSLIRDVLTPLENRFPGEPGEPSFRDGRLHSFRHYFCSICANTGIPERVLKKWLGHRSSKMVHRYYHLHDDESHRQMARLKHIGSTRDQNETGASESDSC